jgi:hypothetical protein
MSLIVTGRFGKRVLSPKVSWLLGIVDEEDRYPWIAKKQGNYGARKVFFDDHVDSEEGGHLFQSDLGHHSRLDGGHLASSRGPIGHLRWRMIGQATRLEGRTRAWDCFRARTIS